MKRLIVLLTLLLVPSVGITAGPCGDYEYTELNAMSKAEFVKEYCIMFDTGKVYAKSAMYDHSRQAQDNFYSCNDVKDKFERIYLRKFGNQDDLNVLKFERCKKP
jgi:hypothetical protein